METMLTVRHFDKNEGWWLLGVLNSKTTDYIFRRIAKPKAGGYFEANKQYLEPLPIPHVDSDQKKQVAAWAEQLQTLTTKRRDSVSQLQARLDGSHCVSEQKDESWIWAEVKSVQKWKDEAPEELSAREKTKWAKEQREAKLCERLERLDAQLKPGSEFVISEDNGEVSFSINGQIEISAFVSSEQGQFLAAQWDQVARTTNITEKFQSKTLVKRLLNVRSSDNEAFIQNAIELNQKITNLDEEISSIESSLNSLIYDLYGLSDDEISMIEAG